jgi:tRNA-specific 2-thiouridylase
MAKVYVGMSGGIDSSAAAFLLKQEGHAVTGVTFRAVQEEGYKKCCSLEEVESARSVCKFLGISHRIVDVRDVFETRVVRYFLESYQNGLTPNPCVFCNRFVKFGALLEYALSEGAEFFATGHYARIVKNDDEFFIQKAKDFRKDQSYFLSYIEKEKLPFVLLVLGNYQKPEVRKIVREAGLPIYAEKPESQDICFVQDDYRDFLSLKGVEEDPGSFIFDGRVVGAHRGIPFYSFGQRRGLNVALGERVFVRNFNVGKNEIELGGKPLSKVFSVNKLNVFTKNFKNGTYFVQIRYQSQIVPAKVKIETEKAMVGLETPQEIVSPGQFAVFYHEDMVYAGGVIETVELL